jgi:soluble lytic murein transglycosylase
MKLTRLTLTLLLLLGSTLVLEAKTFSFDQVNTMPRSVEKDYYLWRFLSQNTTTAAQAQAVIRDATAINSRLRKAYQTRTGQNPPAARPYATGCVAVPPQNWKNGSIANKNFKHGLALMKQNKPTQAAAYFETARKNYPKKYDVDKSLFWLYLSTKNPDYITLLRKSYSVNIYTLMAADTMNAKYPKTITHSITQNRTHGFNIQNPIDWAKVKIKMNNSHNLHSLANNYQSQECIGVYTYLKAQASNHKDAYFPMPYRNTMKKMSPQRQALIYALARQESRFVPASVSRSFALGMLQFMPFLVDHVAKEKGERIDYDEMFNPYKAIEYADFHLDYLTKYLHHPLFIAYAYNGGIGFTRRHIKDPHNFRTGAYEPYMSMEMMSNDEAREYGKKVLANYVIYLNKLGVPTRIFPLLKTLASPSKTDEFRN